VKEQLQLLWKLQTLELQIEEAQKNRATYPLEVERLQGLLRTQEEQQEAEKRRIEELEKERVTMEGELELENERIKRSQLKLLEIKTNKEYQALLQEIDRLKADYAGFLERAQKERVEIEGETATIQEHMAKAERDIAHWQQTREEIVGELDPELMKRYTTLKERRNGIAVVKVKNEGCQGCYVNIPPQLYNEVQKNREIIVCPNCHRILYWENKDGD